MKKNENLEKNSLSLFLFYVKSQKNVKKRSFWNFQETQRDFCRLLSSTIRRSTIGFNVQVRFIQKQKNRRMPPKFPPIRRSKVDRSLAACKMRKLQVKQNALKDLERVRRRAQQQARRLMDDRLRSLETTERAKRENEREIERKSLRQYQRQRAILMEQAGLLDESHREEKLIPRKKIKSLKPLKKTRSEILREKKKQELKKIEMEKERKLAKIAERKLKQREKYNAKYREKKKQRDETKREKERREKEREERESETQRLKLSKQKERERRERKDRMRKKRLKSQLERERKEREEAEIDREFQEWMAQRRKKRTEQHLEIEHSTFLGSLIDEQRTMDPLDTELSQEKMLATKMAEDMGIDVKEEKREEEECMPIPKRWHACFQMVDDDGDGKIDANEMWELFIIQGHEIDKKTVCALLSIADRDGDHKITFDEFRAVKDGLVGDDRNVGNEAENENGALTLFEDEGKLAVDDDDDDFESDDDDDFEHASSK